MTARLGDMTVYTGVAVVYTSFTTLYHQISKMTEEEPLMIIRIYTQQRAEW